jgi:integrase
MILTIKKIESLKPKEKAYKVSDGGGLYLYVSTAGSKVWRTDYNIDGKYKTHTYAKYPDVGLMEARKLHAVFKDKPSSGRRAKQTFKEVAEGWFKIKLPSLKNPKHQIQTANTLERYAFPSIGDKPIDTITRQDLISIVKAMSDKGIADSAERVASRMRMIFDFAVDCGEIEHHPAAGLSRVIAPQKSVPMPSIHPTQAGELLFKIDQYGEPVTRLGLLLAARCFARDKELRALRVEHVKLDERVIVVPGELMKMGKPHVIPLSRQVVKLLTEHRATNFLLESPFKRERPISENTLLFALYRLGYRGEMTTHGFRSLASTVLNESGLFKDDAIERQLAHDETNKVRKAYNRAEYLEERVEMMQWYSDWLDQQLANYLKGSGKQSQLNFS